MNEEELVDRLEEARANLMYHQLEEFRSAPPCRRCTELEDEIARTAATLDKMQRSA